MKNAPEDLTGSLLWGGAILSSAIIEIERESVEFSWRLRANVGGGFWMWRNRDLGGNEVCRAVRLMWTFYLFKSVHILTNKIFLTKINEMPNVSFQIWPKIRQPLLLVRVLFCCNWRECCWDDALYKGYFSSRDGFANTIDAYKYTIFDLITQRIRPFEFI